MTGTPDVWEFRSPKVGAGETYADGTRVPALGCDVYLNNLKVGKVDVHMHRRAGPDGVVDTSYGATFIVFGAPQGGA